MADALPAGRDPCLDAIDQPRVGLRLELLAQPVEVHAPRIVPTPRLALHIAGLALPSEKPTDGRLANPEERGRLSVGPASLRTVRFDDAPSQIDR